MWLKNHYQERDDPEFTKPVHDVSGLLDRLNHFGGLGDAPIRLRYATLVYMIAQQGIGILNNTLPELPYNFPSREEFGEKLVDYNRGRLYMNEDDKDMIEIVEQSKILAKNTLQREYPDLCSPEVLLWAGAPVQLSIWPDKNEINSVKEILDGISAGSIDPLMFDEPQKTGIQLYLVAQHGVEVSGYLFENGERTADNHVTLRIEALFDTDGNISTIADQSIAQYNVKLNHAGNGVVRRNCYYRIDASLQGLDGHEIEATIHVADWDGPVTQEETLGN